MEIVDIYGDEESEFVIPMEEPEDQPMSNATTATTITTIPDEPSPTTSSSLPAKPQSSSGSLSYSAQIAQQFSSYQQTPSQERQPAPKAGPSSIPTMTDSIFGKKPSEMHDAGDYFSQFGKVDAVTIMRDPSGTSRGFAFLTFEDPSAVQVVTAQDHFLDGKAIDPKRAIPREEHLRNTRYFVGGLAPSTTSDSMKEFFSAYGKVVDATVMLDRESGRSKGFGFVTFEDAANSDQLVGKNLVLDDKQIEVKTAQPRSQREQARNANAGVGNMGNMSFTNAQEARPPMPFISQQPNPMSMMYQRMPMLPSGMPMMSMNPMMMGQFHPMAGMGMMGGMGMGAMNGMGGMRLGMGPMGGMSGGMGVRGGMPGMNRVAGPVGRMVTTGGGVGPSRVMTRGQHSFHPYAR
ncbi:hnRNP A1-gamma isoform [Desarmillaria tabescens]|uniref:HnRNP A1-gamma isoform n=1 Tax=Armillaria tabescens TaxID=1929756 RepID=A0AA39NCN6_ARMTA|nr:hnRNP A1-gamma isoform [Desarmillaria tabescens]KAK0463146.1 hnRNP A1-gamma isoform [Desarmillaria tabescens]